MDSKWAKEQKRRIEEITHAVSTLKEEQAEAKVEEFLRALGEHEEVSDFMIGLLDKDERVRDFTQGDVDAVLDLIDQIVVLSKE